MRLANLHGRATIVTSTEDPAVGVDVATLSDGEYGPGLAGIYERWPAFVEWVRGVDLTAAESVTLSRADLGSPSPTPRQIFGIGLNYRAHAAESGFDLPDTLPPTFTKFVSSLTGPESSVVLPPGGHTDWEVELVVVIGVETHLVTAAEAWDRVAGLAVGQDISERVSQLAGPAPQFSLGKSFPGFSPVGPWLTTTDELSDPDDLELGCTIDGETVQQSRTKDLLFAVPQLIEGLSRTVTLYPGDLIFTGTPEGVGLARNPQRWLQPGEVLDSWIEGLGTLRQTFTTAEHR